MTVQYSTVQYSTVQYSTVQYCDVKFRNFAPNRHEKTDAPSGRNCHHVRGGLHKINRTIDFAVLVFAILLDLPLLLVFVMLFGFAMLLVFVMLLVFAMLLVFVMLLVFTMPGLCDAPGLRIAAARRSRWTTFCLTARGT
jgi:hypothetical protein